MIHMDHARVALPKPYTVCHSTKKILTKLLGQSSNGIKIHGLLIDDFQRKMVAGCLAEMVKCVLHEGFSLPDKTAHLNASTAQSSRVDKSFK